MHDELGQSLTRIKFDVAALLRDYPPGQEPPSERWQAVLKLADQTIASVRTLQPIHSLLSDREFEVLRLIASGRTMTQIAGDLNLSVPTVSTYRARILEKMNLSSTAELMLFALRNHLVE